MKISFVAKNQALMRIRGNPYFFAIAIIEFFTAGAMFAVFFAVFGGFSNPIYSYNIFPIKFIQIWLYVFFSFACIATVISLIGISIIFTHTIFKVFKYCTLSLCIGFMILIISTVIMLYLV